MVTKASAKKPTKTSVKKQKDLVLSVPVEVKVIYPEYVPLSSLKYLDSKQLSSGRHRIEIGSLQGGCCAKTVYARIEKGLVVRLEVEPCEESEKLPRKEVQALFKSVAAKLPSQQTDWNPVPVAEFLTSVIERRINIGTGAGCFWICIWRYCVFCCKPFVTHPPSPFIDCWIERRAD